MQSFTPDIEDALGPLEQTLRESFIPSLFHDLKEGTPGRGVTRIPVKQAVLTLPEPTKTDPKNCTAFCDITVNLVAALRGQEEFRTEDHEAYLQEGREEVHNRVVLRAGGGGLKRP